MSLPFLQSYLGLSNSLQTAQGGASPIIDPTRGVFAGGYAITNVMDYITIATTGNATDFGDLTVARSEPGGVNSSTRGVWSGGSKTVGDQNTIDYITIATTGNATDFGDHSVSRVQIGAVCSSTRGVFGGGSTGSDSNVMDYITIATTGNAVDFGDLTVARRLVPGIQNGL